MTGRKTTRNAKLNLIDVRRIKTVGAQARFNHTDGVITEK
jgi:hypothetical protein